MHFERHQPELTKVRLQLTFTGSDPDEDSGFWNGPRRKEFVDIAVSLANVFRRADVKLLLWGTFQTGTVRADIMNRCIEKLKYEGGWRDAQGWYPPGLPCGGYPVIDVTDEESDRIYESLRQVVGEDRSIFISRWRLKPGVIFFDIRLSDEEIAPVKALKEVSNLHYTPSKFFSSLREIITHAGRP